MAPGSDTVNNKPHLRSLTAAPLHPGETMCGRFALTTPAASLAELFRVDVPAELAPRYNIAPTTQVAAVVQADGERVLEHFRWGLIPSWSKASGKHLMINARAETAATKASFRGPFRRRRLLVPADGFYEWQRIDGQRRPHLIQLRQGAPFAMAGLWDRWVDPASDEEIHSCAILTTTGNALVQPIHDRMPVILPPDRWDLWLDPTIEDRAMLSELLVPYPADQMQLRRVNQAVGNVRNQGPEVQQPPAEA